MNKICVLHVFLCFVMFTPEALPKAGAISEDLEIRNEMGVPLKGALLYIDTVSGSIEYPSVVFMISAQDVGPIHNDVKIDESRGRLKPYLLVAEDIHGQLNARTLAEKYPTFKSLEAAVAKRLGLRDFGDMALFPLVKKAGKVILHIDRDTVIFPPIEITQLNQ